MFDDLELQRRFDRDGFVAVPLLSPAEAEDARRRVKAIYEARDQAADAASLEQAYHVSLLHPDRDYRFAAHAMVREILAERVTRLIPDYRLLVGSFVVKPAGAEALSLHRDWRMTAEAAEATLTCWCALEDVTAANGALAFIPGSHRVLADNVEGPALPSFFSRYGDGLRRPEQIVPVRAGEALIFDYRVLHWSAPNASAETRLALSTAFIPAAAQPAIHVARDGPEGPFHRLEADAGRWPDLVMETLQEPEPRVDRVRRVEQRNGKMPQRQLERLLGLERAPPSWGSRARRMASALRRRIPA